MIRIHRTVSYIRMKRKRTIACALQPPVSGGRRDPVPRARAAHEAAAAAAVMAAAGERELAQAAQAVLGGRVRHP